MKKFLTLFSALILGISASAADSLAVLYRIRLDQNIDPAARRLVTLGLEKAAEAEADYVLLDLNTYGGAVDAADSIRNAILRSDIPVIFKRRRRLSRKFTRCVTKKLKKYPSIPYCGRSRYKNITSIAEVRML